MATTNSSGAITSSTTPQTGHSIVVTTTVELIGVAAFAALAGMDDDLGKLLVVVMWGIVLGWLLLNISTFSNWINKA